ncbi:MAG: cysteine desulfurase [Parcubacteria group bacterium]|jgi:cysteine desulfurase|nr:cysteine desulfurase [Parcubacteria group bacterium]
MCYYSNVVVKRKQTKNIQTALKATANKTRIFLDYASVTPIDPEVEREMVKVQKQFWANPSSLHQEGEKAKTILEESRVKIAKILHCKAGEIFFTSGGTESLNIAILGTVKVFPQKKQKFLPHIIVSTIEHPAVLEPIKFLSQEGEVEVSFVNPDQNGRIHPESIKKELKENTVLVIVQHANSEIGTIQPIRAISKVVKNFREFKKTKLPKTENESLFYATPYFLVDACQSALYEDVSLERLGADLLVLDGVKIYGPRGAGILAKKSEVKISPIIFGGGQEEGLRSGTENIASALGLAKALEIAEKKREKEKERLTNLRDYTIKKILEIENSSLNGDLENRLPNNINVCIPDQDSEFLVIKLDTLGFAISAASACHTLALENSSYVIESLGKKECASSSLRITLGRDTRKSDLDGFISVLKKVIK